MNFLIFILLLFNQTGKFTSPKGPVYISAEKMEIYKEEKRIVFSGKVSMRQGELVVYADRATIFLDKKEEVKKVVAEGNIKAVYRDKTLSCEKADYDVRKGILYLTGRPIMSDKETVVRGESIKVDVNRKTVEIKNAVTIIKEHE